jgi:hypothetical protein
MLRIIGDLHGKYDKYFPLIEDCEYSLQVGDIGYSYLPIKDLDHTKHKFILGNHDNFPDAIDCKNILHHGFGEYSHGGIDFFYLSGAFSIDWQYRVKQEVAGIWPRTWFEEEELTLKQLDNAVSLYAHVKPEVVITHECPRTIANLIGNPNVLRSWGYNPNVFTTRTSEALEAMFRLHQPKYWFFGHYHRSWNDEVCGTNFRCLAELEYFDFNKEN